jgi:1-acyl-sn-glycerol-3-phosphate acyltransferase
MQEIALHGTGQDSKVWSARIRLASLWLSQAARVMADNCLRLFVVLELAAGGTELREGAWHLVTAVLMVPAVFLAPVNGAIGNSLPKPRVLIGSAAFCLAAVVIFALVDGQWIACWALVAVGTAIYGPTRYALLPAAASDTHLPLTRINGWVEMGAGAAVVAGLVAGLNAFDYEMGRFEAAVVLAGSLNLLGVLAALPVRFASDVRRPESPAQAVAGFFRDCRRILREREACTCLVGLASLRALVTVMVGALAAAVFTEKYDLQELAELGAWVFAGVALGSLLAGCQRHPRRVLSLVPIGATGMAAGTILIAIGVLPGQILSVILGMMAGLINVPLSATYQAALPADARGNGMAVRNFTDYVLVATLAGLFYALADSTLVTVTGQFWLLAALATGLAVAAWRTFIREVMEQLLEAGLWPLYRIRACGPGLEQVPLRGPLIVVANHSAWFDPMWLAKVLPCRFIPMMTSVFYDLPVIRWLMVHVAHAIRVQAATFRRDVPELKQAINALDRGEALIIFPEGSMRRRTDQPLRMFGQGIWHILRERPNTPVIVCWIEGGWGSYFSYCNGLPTKNKPFDFRRPINIAVSPPQVLSPELLDNQKATRVYLMQACLEARKYLGLDVPSLEKLEAVQEPGEDGGTPEERST